MTPLPHAGVGSWRFWGGPRTLPSASESGLNAERAVASSYHEAKPKRLDGAKRSQSHPLRHDPTPARGGGVMAFLGWAENTAERSRVGFERRASGREQLSRGEAKTLRRSEAKSIPPPPPSSSSGLFLRLYSYSWGNLVIWYSGFSRCRMVDRSLRSKSWKSVGNRTVFCRGFGI